MTTIFNPNEHPHRRYNPLVNEWMLVSPHRAKRPWQGEVAPPPREDIPVHDPNCFLCPGNTRKTGETNPQYDSTYVFDNDFPALLTDTPITSGDAGDHPLFRVESDRGICRVMCYNPRHNLTMAQMDAAAIRPIVDMWAEQTLDVGSHDFINYVQLFENRGAMMGHSSPHPHGQLWSNMRLPREITKELAAQRDYFNAHGVTLLTDYLAEEQRRDERIVYANEYFCVVVPFWAVWPFETMVICNQAVPSLSALDDAQRDGLADALRNLTVRYDNIFKTSFPYSMGWHQQPTDGALHPYWHLHAHFYPPLLRSATIKKHMVGYEMLAGPQRDITAEQAAARIREQSDVHYTQQ
ncbi:MAG: UDP-glucose--hexose-1-phosphate uridylyltransferase [Anaerolineae bacterium]|nr:UDP-glucose--hexose-1-phosphate uridylyltransferase [Anaerolineae bacterium]